MQVEPLLQDLDGEVLSGASAIRSDGARVDIAVDDFCGNRQRAFLDVRVFNPFAPSNRQSSLAAAYKSHEKEKKRAYRERIGEVEHGSFSPLVLSVFWGMAKEANIFKCLASLLSEKWTQHYSTIISWLRCIISFSLIRSYIRCLRGARLARGHPIGPIHCPIDLMRLETHFAV